MTALIVKYKKVKFKEALKLASTHWVWREDEGIDCRFRAYGPRQECVYLLCYPRPLRADDPDSVFYVGEEIPESITRMV